jgi:hypothetical protein
MHPFAGASKGPPPGRGLATCRTFRAPGIKAGLEVGDAQEDQQIRRGDIGRAPFSLLD